jgi:hypothetical protein
MKKICFYIMKADTGFAPNPYHDVCTLAACTPNHMRAKLEAGDWIVGCFRSGAPPRVVFIMRVDERLSLDNYYRDPRFAVKKAAADLAYRRCGDNIYCRGPDGLLCRAPEARFFHTDCGNSRKDIRGDRVFVGRDFLYLGKRAILLPKPFIPSLPGRGVKYLREREPEFDAFMQWRGGLGRGMQGSPRDAGGTGCRRQKTAPCG